MNRSLLASASITVLYVNQTSRERDIERHVAKIHTRRTLFDVVSCNSYAEIAVDIVYGVLDV
jgi:hypothetical protein